MPKDDSNQPNYIYGFKTDIRQKAREVELRIDKVDKFNIPYGLIPIRAVYGVLILVALLLFNFFFIVLDLKRILFLGIPLALFDIGILILVFLYAFIFPSFGSLLKISVNLMSHLYNNRQVRKGKKPRSKATGFIPARKDGLVRCANGDVGRMFWLDGKTLKTAYPQEVLKQEEIAAAYHNNRNRNTTETIITSSEKQNTELQIENLRALEKTNTNEGVQDLINIQRRYVEEKIEGARTTFVQYLFMVAPDERNLEDAIETLIASVSEGLYYNVQAMTKQETDRLLSEIKGFR
ncbi:hypothetical protein [Staphylococcus warneri]|uniref:hypothetical protein n=1 Tax=Staphylococcus warneri TaxID=1292 RepID=UPI001A8C580B|nr:hypothetical protein [Staphylococcus warneri]MBO0377088.1 hypothetical protein [Staphylococcus warneri]MCR1798130.1 hypothetical protein [Staphylococcus warneri]HCU8763854.1 hypothetical protein [Staphylococcus aureus]